MSTELNVYRFGAGKQTAKGTALVAPSRRFITVGGDIAAPRDQGGENWSDGTTLWGDQTDWVNSVVGRGTLGIECTPAELAWLLWNFNGAETVTVNAERATYNDHVNVPGTTMPFYTTWWKSQGLTVQQLQRHIDCLTSQIQIEGSTANKALRVSPEVISLDPAEKAVDPTWPAVPNKDLVLLFTEAAGTFTVDTVVIRGTSQFTVTLNGNLDPVFTDDIVPYEVQRGTPAAQIACTIQADADGQAQWNKYMYGTASPSTGTKPIKTLPAMGSYTFEAKKGVGAGLLGRFKFEAPGVRWNLPDWPAPNPDGGNPTLALAGGMRQISGQPLWRTTTTDTAIAFTS